MGNTLNLKIGLGLMLSLYFLTAANSIEKSNRHTLSDPLFRGAIENKAQNYSLYYLIANNTLHFFIMYYSL